jgi:hypothetical protein
LFLLLHNARDNIIEKIATELKIGDINSVLRSMNVRINQHDLSVFPPLVNPLSGKVQPPWKHLKNRHFRVVSRIVHMGNSSIKMQHRLLTVPQSQVHRDFNNREEDAKYQQLQEGDEPERLFASSEDGLVHIKWMEDETGKKHFKSEPCPFRLAIGEPFSQFIREKAPALRPKGSARPDNAFRIEIHLRKSDEDQVRTPRYLFVLLIIITFLKVAYN